MKIWTLFEPKHKNFKCLLKIEGLLWKILNIKRLMSIPRPLQQYHFHVILIWWHSPFKANKIIQAVSAGFWRWNAARESFPHLQTTAAQLRIGPESWNWCHLNRLEMRIIPKIYKKNFQHVWWMKQLRKTSWNTIFQNPGGRALWDILAYRGNGNSNTL